MAYADAVFEVFLQNALTARKGFVGDVDGFVMFSVIGENSGIWTLDMRRGGTARVYKGKVEKPDIHIIVRDTYLDNLLRGEMSVDAVRNNNFGIETTDAKKLESLASFLRVETSVLGLRSSQAAHH